MYKILIVDDLYNNIKMAIDYIETYLGINHEIKIATSLNYAKTFLNKYFDLIICDNKLGDGYGAEFIKEYKNTFKDTVIIFHSADEIDAIKMSGLRCVDFAKELKGELLSFKERTTIKLDQLDGSYEVEKNLFNKELCDERHEVLNTNMEKIASKLNQFVFVGIGTLFSTLSILVVQLIKH